MLIVPWFVLVFITTQKTFSCSKSTIEMPEYFEKYIQKLTLKTPEPRQWCQWGCSYFFFVNFDYSENSVSIVDFEQIVFGGWH